MRVREYCVFAHEWWFASCEPALGYDWQRTIWLSFLRPSTFGLRAVLSPVGLTTQPRLTDLQARATIFSISPPTLLE